LHDTVKSGEAEIQTSSQSTRSKPVGVALRLPLEGFTSINIDNEGALKIIEHSSEVHSHASPKAQSPYRQPMQAIRPKLIKPIFTNIVHPTAEKQSIQQAPISIRKEGL
jgi:hypothetical protein